MRGRPKGGQNCSENLQGNTCSVVVWRWTVVSNVPLLYGDRDWAAAVWDPRAPVWNLQVAQGGCSAKAVWTEPVYTLGCISGRWFKCDPKICDMCSFCSDVHVLQVCFCCCVMLGFFFVCMCVIAVAFTLHIGWSCMSRWNIDSVAGCKHLAIMMRHRVWTELVPWEEYTTKTQ